MKDVVKIGTVGKERFVVSGVAALLVALLLALPSLLSVAGASRSGKPNVIIIYTDDHGYTDLEISRRPTLIRPCSKTLAWGCQKIMWSTASILCQRCQKLDHDRSESVVKDVPGALDIVVRMRGGEEPVVVGVKESAASCAFAT